MAKQIEIWLGTRKGAFVFRSKDRKKWAMEGPHFRGSDVNHVIQDPREPNRYYAAVNSAWFGPHIHSSEDRGKTWHLADKGVELRGIEGESLKRLWHIQPGHADEPGNVYAGGDPGVLFKSTDWGQTWDMQESLTLHATRPQWRPGAGGMCLHSIQCLGGGRMVIGMSVNGVMRTFDGGKTWEPFNGNVRADFQPNKFPEVGVCVHKLRAHPANPEQLYQQNHCGMYRAKLDGKKWTDINRGLPTRFGFGLAVPATEKETVFTVPMESPEYRCNLNGKLEVARSRDGGKNWELLSRGLPTKGAHVTVLREAMTSDLESPAGVYFGTTSGTVFYSRTSGNSWDVLADNLPPVYSVTVAAG